MRHWTRAGSGLLISISTQLVSFDWCENSAIDVKMDESVVEEKSSFKMLGLTFSSKLDWGYYIISIAKSACKNIEDLIRSMKLLSPKVALYLCKSAIQSFMEYCCHVWTAVPSCYLEVLDKLQKWICWTVSIDTFLAQLGSGILCLKNAFL